MRPYWDVVRHRAPADAIERVGRWRDDGRLRVIAGAVRGHRIEGETLEVEICQRDGAVVPLPVDVVVRCIGPAVEGSDLASPLLQAMVARGVAVRDEAGLGIRVDAAGRVFDAAGVASEAISALGALRRAEAWETTAVPEIARDAAALALRIHERVAAMVFDAL